MRGASRLSLKGDGMPRNHVKEALDAGAWVSGPIIEEIRTVGGVKMLANAGHDFLWFDCEHNMYDWETLLTLVQYSLACNIVPFVRVTDLSYPLIARALDTGALGVIIPRVENRAQVEEAVHYAKYPPLGRRGAGGMARNAYETKGVLQAIEDGNAETMVIVQIESPEGIENLESMVTVPGVDVICVGPQDLSINLGLHGKFDDGGFIDAIRRINEVCEEHGIPTGMVSRDAASFKRWNELGCRFLVCNSDLSLLYQQASRDTATLRELLGD
jgi:2-keto-3-deoxy-L-rhamnonate aldolase RhmA